MPHDAIAHYHDLLTDDLAGASDAWLARQTKARGLSFGDRHVCSVLRPRFLSPRQYRFLQQRVGLLLPAFDAVHRAALADAAFRGQFRLRPEEEELLAADPGFPCPFPTGRLDSFFVSENELKFTEHNAETPAGGAYHDALTEMFLGLPIVREFARHYELRPLPARPGVLQALTDSFRRWSGTSDPPRIGILDWREVPTYSEFVLFADYFRAQGLECVIADPREVEYRDGKLTVGDFHITLIYKRVLIGELLERGGMNHPIVRAVRDGAVCMVNPFRCKILYKKASLAVLSDERNAHLLTPEQREAVAAHIPWTRLVEERHTEYKGEKIDLVPFIHRSRDNLVLKPNDEYGGKGIVLGWNVDAAEWEKAVATALAEPYVVQERINIPSESFPDYAGGRVRFLDRMLDTNPYVVHGAHVDGCLTRISTAALLNVTAGGGSTVPTFVVEPR